ncbi:hypothetical protein ACJMK2_021995 [Sinanodonta woodiana]|uniref:Uncharacterized protein n=1 Tax=Sinanodonta woodiana TaxID=1069815 RepID=A0ABD3TJC5_SINWO
MVGNSLFSPTHSSVLTSYPQPTQITYNLSLSTATWTPSKAISEKQFTSEGNTFLDDGATSAITGADAMSTYIASLLEAKHANFYDFYSSEITGSMAHAIPIYGSITNTQDIMHWINVQNTDTFYSLLAATEANSDSFEDHTILTKPLGDVSPNTMSTSSSDTETYPTDDYLIKYACVDKKCLYIQPVG